MLYTYDFNHFLSFYSFTYFIEYCNYFEKPEYYFSPPHLLSILKLWFTLIFGLNFIFFCFKLIIHYHTQKPTYLGSMENGLSRKAEMPTSVVDTGDSPFFTSPLPHCQQPHYSHHPSSTLPPNWPSHLRELCKVLHEVNAIKIYPSWIRTLRGVNFGFLSHLGCSGQNAIIFSREGLV